MTQPDGIDLTRSGWNNPENLQTDRSYRTKAHVEPLNLNWCENHGPDGWVCDLPAGHQGDLHSADVGKDEPLRWQQNYANVSTLGTPPDKPVFIPSTIEPYREGGPLLLGVVADMAEKALASDRPSTWAVALSEILKVTRGH